MTTTNTQNTVTAYDMFVEKVNELMNTTKDAIRAEGQAVGCGILPTSHKKATLSYIVALQSLYYNDILTYRNLKAEYDIDVISATITPITEQKTPNIVDTIDKSADIPQESIEAWIGEELPGAIDKHTLHTAYISADVVKLKSTITKMGLHDEATALTTGEVNAIASEYLICNRIGQLITPPATDTPYWISRLQQIIPTLVSDRNKGLAELGKYIKHDGCLDIGQSINKEQALVAVLQQLAAFGGFLESCSNEKSLDYPSYLKRDNIPATVTVQVGTVIIIAPVNRSSSTNKMLVAKTEYSCKLTLKESYYLAAKLKTVPEPIVVPIIVNTSNVDLPELVWDDTVFDVELTGGKIDAVNDIASSDTKKWSWSRCRYAIRRLVERSETQIIDSGDFIGDYDPMRSIPGVMRVSRKSDYHYCSSDRFDRLITPKIDIMSSLGRWVDAYSLVGYTLQR